MIPGRQPSAARVREAGRGRRRAALCGLALWWAALAACTSPGHRLAAPTARGGVLDLRDWRPEEDGPVDLDGEWRFVWGTFVAPSVGCPAPAEGASLARVPGTWPRQGGAPAPRTGYASYCLSVLLAPRVEPLSLYFPRVRTAGALWVNGRVVSGAGTVGTTAERSQPDRRDHVLSIAPSERLELVVHVSNFHFRTGGIPHPLRLGAPIDLEPLAEGRSSVVSAFFAGAFLVLGLYHLVAHTLGARSRGSVTFGVLCVVIAVYQLAREYNLLALLWPDLAWTSGIRLEYSLFGLAVLLTARFFAALFPREFPDLFAPSCTVLSLAFIGLVWLLPVLFSSTWLLVGFQLATLVLGGYGAWRTAVAMRQGRPGARWVLVGGTLLLLATLGDGFVARLVPGAPRLLPYGFLGLTFAQAVLLAIVQERAAARSKVLSTRLLTLASEKLALEQEVFRDPLTGLENRRRLDVDVQELRRRVPRDEESSEHVSLLYLDLDRFKEVNDRFGHEAGDAVLKQVADRIRRSVRPYDLSIRLGGDEFVVLLPDLGLRGAEESARRLRERISEPIHVGEHEHSIEVSIGVAAGPARSVDLGELLREADRRMYAEKQRHARERG